MLLAAADQAQVVGEAAVVQGEVIRLPEIALDQHVVDEGQLRVPDDLALVLVLLEDDEDVIEGRRVRRRRSPGRHAPGQ